jgi:hypothetical protein
VDRRERRRLERKRFSPELTRLGCLSGLPCTVNRWWDEVRQACIIRNELHSDGVIDFATTDGDRISELVREYYSGK